MLTLQLQPRIEKTQNALNDMKRLDAEIKLRELFGIPRFYDEQWEAIERLLKGERILMIQKTGFGKSLCYQFPATQFPGITVVFSPLVALMRDQVKNLRNHGIAAGFINSEQTKEENDETIEEAEKGLLKILYIAPERQENEAWIEATRRLRLSMVVIDEAHTISTWGHDFRPAFRKIIDLVNLLPSHLPVLATTATATLKVQKDIEKQIGGKLTTIRGTLARPNFRLYVINVKSEEEKYLWLAQNIIQLPGTGLIYTGTRVKTELYSKWLQYLNISAIEYHAGLDPDSRKDIENGLMSNKWKAIISTNALGMGIDKPDIRFVIHTQVPVSPVHYYQEIGRAGRDGDATFVILLYNGELNREGIPEDLVLPKSFIESARPALSKYEHVISLIQTEPLGEREIVKRANLKAPQFRIIKADLMDQGIMREVRYGSLKKYEYISLSSPIDPSGFEALRKSKLEELEKMEGYIWTNKPRMQYLCEFLDDSAGNCFENCDNTTLPAIPYLKDPSLEHDLKDFQESLFPMIETTDSTSKKIGDSLYIVKYTDIDELEITQKTEVIGKFIKGSLKVFSHEVTFTLYEPIMDLIRMHEQKKSHLIDGYASSYYGVSAVGQAIHRSKYENGGDFPDFLLTSCLRVIGRKYGHIKFDLVCHIPPTQSGKLVENFAGKIARAIGVPISNGLIKVRETKEQKIFQSSFAKQDNIKEAFDFENASTIKGKTILLIDDIYDSGATLKEAGRVLTKYGARWIAPLVIAKTVGGTI